jgi:hypothetical protein
LCIPKLEAYHEYIHRRNQENWTEDRAYEITLALTGDITQAEAASNAVKFAKTPLVPE